MTIKNVELYMQNNPLIYREKLTIPRNVNFGIEIEMENVDIDEVTGKIEKYFGTEWSVKEDKSLTKGQNAEIASPVLQNEKKTWVLLRDISELLKRLKPSYTNCSFQVNFDGKLLPDYKSRIRFLKLFAVYEDIIYHFSKGEDEMFRASLDTYAHPIILTLKGSLEHSQEETLAMFSNNKRYGVIFKDKVKDLIEFRTPNGTNNKILWQNYITTFYYLLKYATNPSCNEKELDRYIDEFCKIDLLKEYEACNLEKAINLSNMIFPRKIDQTSFIHQYTKK